MGRAGVGSPLDHNRARAPFTLERMPRETQRRITAIRLNGVETAERIGAAAYATHFAQHLMAHLCSVEGQLIQQVPPAAPHLEALTYAFRQVACFEIGGMVL